MENLEVGEGQEVYHTDYSRSWSCILSHLVLCGESFSTTFLSNPSSELISSDTAGEAGGLLCGLVKSSLLLILLHSPEEY